MYIGLLTESKSGLRITYSYQKRNQEEKQEPTLIPEPQSSALYDFGGALFTDIVGFDGNIVGKGGVDIHFYFSKNCFIDHMTFLQAKDSHIQKITVLRSDSDTVRPVGAYHGETGRPISAEEVFLPLGVFADHLILRLESDFEHICLGRLKLFGAIEPEQFVYPIPKKMENSGEYLAKISGIKAEDGDASFAASYFKELYEKEYCFSGSGAIITFEKKELPPEHFELTVSKKGACLRAGDRRGFVYGAAKLMQLCSEQGIRCCRISDAPYMEIRGVHLGLPEKHQLPFLKNVVKYLLAPLGYNMIILQLSGVMEYKRHPEINRAWEEAVCNYQDGKWPAPPHYGFLGSEIFSQEEVKELCSYFRDYGLEVVPEIQAFGHTQYITMAHPELAEVEDVPQTETLDLFSEDARPDSFYHHSMCPNHPGYESMFRDLIDEVTEVIRPERFIHIGHDEIYTIGKCKVCKTMDPAEIYAKEVIFLHDYIATKGLATMLWSDMMTESEEYETTPAIHQVPKDLICLPFTWYFHLDEDVEREISDHDFSYVIGNFYSSHYQRFNRRKQFPGLLGAEVSTWVPCSEDYYCYEGKIFDFIYSANMMWQEEHFESMRRTYTMLSGQYSEKAMERIRGTIGLNNCAFPLTLTNCEMAPFDIQVDYDYAVELSRGIKTLCEPKACVQSLVFTQATDKAGDRIPWQEIRAMGQYVITYESGHKEFVPICYGRDICEYKRPYAEPYASPLFRHEGYVGTSFSKPICGKTVGGEDYTLYQYTWKNPHPHLHISKIELEHFGETDAAVLVFGLHGTDIKE